MLPGGPVDMLADDTLTARLGYVNFDGKKALAASREIGADLEIGKDFVNQYCAETVTAMEVTTIQLIRLLANVFTLFLLSIPATKFPDLFSRSSIFMESLG